ncbi:PB1 domain-containing protein [Ditylenchus destructor]|uniref:PB1 domain-containing protein n=1 Tax=Ditylenchus destructor TaxID=166010 RepID=A0AAD4N0Q9_9BILA|nr:PB1 domain-containing protein [Ditylenchus destructor]
MVNNGTIESTVLKSKYGADIRKSQLHHTQDLNFNDLVLMMQRVFQIKASASISLKYRDSEGDWITLANDDDVVFALQHEPSLYVEVFTDGDRVSRQLSPVNTDSIAASRNSVKEEVTYDHRSSTPQRQTAPVGQDLSTSAPASQDGCLQHKNPLTHVDQSIHKEAHEVPPTNQYHQPIPPSSQDQFHQFSNFQHQPTSDGVDASGPPVIQPSVQKEVNVSSAYGNAPPSQPTPQRPPSIGQGSHYGSMTPPVSQEYQYGNHYQQQPQHNYSAVNEYSAPPTIQPSDHKEVVVSSAYGQNAGTNQHGYPGQQQPPQQAPPPSHQPPTSVSAPYGAVPPPPVSQYNASSQQPPMAQPPQHMAPYSGGSYQPATNYGGAPQQPPLAPPPSQQQPSFAPPPVSSVIGGAPSQNPFARGPGQGYGRPSTNQGNYY